MSVLIEKKMQLLEKKHALQNKIKDIETELKVIQKILIENDAMEIGNKLGIEINAKNASKFNALSNFKQIFEMSPKGKGIHKSTIYTIYQQKFPEASGSSIRGYFHRFREAGYFVPVKKGSKFYRLNEDLINSP